MSVIDGKNRRHVLFLPRHLLVVHGHKGNANGFSVPLMCICDVVLWELFRQMSLNRTISCH